MILQGCNQGDAIKVQTQSLLSLYRELKTQQAATKVQQDQAAPESKVSQQLRMIIRQARMVTRPPSSDSTVSLPV